MVLKKGAISVDKTVLPHDHGNFSKNLQHDDSTQRATEIISDVFKTLSDASRIELFWVLCHCEECVVNLSALLGMKGSLTSHHLKLLKNAGLVVSRREGKEVYYTAAKTEKAKILHETIERISELACPAEETSADVCAYDANVHIITQVHDLMTSDLRKRYTIEELALRYSVNMTTLKMAFKAYYKQPIAAYMKEYRIKCAKKLLQETDKTLAQISSEVGYENPSKFTAAFKAAAGVLPSKYRKMHAASKER